MKLFIFFLPALFLIAGCATLKDKGLEPNYEVFVQKSLTKLSESDLFNYSDSINLNWDETDFGFFIKGEFERISIENALAEMRGKNWSGKPIFQKGKDFPCSAIDIFFSDLVKYVSTDNSYSFLTSVAVHEQNLYDYQKNNTDSASNHPIRV